MILVGEMRDTETAEIAIRASLTGHLVFTTLHTNDAPAAVMRLVDMGVAPYLVASCLRGVLGQRLVRRLCRHCRRAVPWDEAAQGLDLDVSWSRKLAGGRFWIATGCDNCIEGYSGRTGIFELMQGDAALRKAMRQGGLAASELRQAALASGMQPLADDAAAKLAEGITDLREVTGALVS